MKVLGVVLLVLGVLGLVYQGFSYTRNDRKASVGPIDISVEKTERVNVPLWASIIALVAGGAMVASGRK